MTTTVAVGEAALAGMRLPVVYLGGVFRPEAPLDLPDGTELTICFEVTPPTSVARQTSGMITLHAPEEVQREIMESSVFADPLPREGVR